MWFCDWDLRCVYRPALVVPRYPFCYGIQCCASPLFPFWCVMWVFLPNFPGALFSIYHIFLTHKIRPYYWIYIMFFCSMESVLICTCTSFCNFLVIIIFISSFLWFYFLLLLPCASNRSGSGISFTLLPCQTSPFLMLIPYFSSSISSTLLCHLEIVVIFFPASCCPSGPSLHHLIFTCTGGRSAFFQRRCIFLGYTFWSSIGPFGTHFLISGFMNVASSVVYFSCKYLPGIYLKLNIIS